MATKLDDALVSYQDSLPLYQEFAQAVRSILDIAISKDFGVHSIEFRAKSVDSFRKKAEKVIDDVKSTPKYSEPLSEITDLAGVRVIAFFPKSLEQICQIIEKEFEVTEKKDMGEERFSQRRLGYKSIHYLVKLNLNRKTLVEYQKYNNLVAEIQVRTILQHAWAEMEHDIQYKSADQIPTSIQKRFIALAGMLEIADREFQAVQDEDAKLRQGLQSSLEDDLFTAEMDSTATANRKLNTQGKEVKDAVTLHSNSTRARELVLAGNYTEAISHYTKLINEQPDSYTLYIGRAKAQFLGGNRSAALSDLESAKGLNATDVAIAVLHRKISEGLLSPSTATSEGWRLSTMANNQLARGEGEDAFKEYSKAQDLGLPWVFATFNKAMACSLINDVDGSTYLLDQFTPNPESPMKINSLSLRAINAAIVDLEISDCWHNLKEELAAMQWFNYGLSPLRYLEMGFEKRGGPVRERVSRVFALLKE